MQDNFSIRDWKNETVYKEEYKEGSNNVKESKSIIPGTYAGRPVVLYKHNPSDETSWEVEFTDSGKIIDYADAIANLKLDYDADYDAGVQSDYSKRRSQERDHYYGMNEVEDFEADAEDIEFEIPGDENAKPVVDKELNKSLSKQDKIIKQWQDINAQMQSNLKDFKEAGDENAKDMAKMALKDLTPAYRAAKEAYEKLKGIKL